MRRTLSMILIICLIFSMGTQSFAADGGEIIKDVLNKLNTIITKFKDIENHWAKQFIAELINRNMISGYPDGTFKPDANIKVTEFMILALNAKKVSIPKTDIWYEGAMKKAAEQGLVKVGEFDNLNTRLINRGEIARVIVRGLGEAPSPGSTKFNDDNKISAELKGYVKRANELGIIGGYPDGSFKADGYATRAEASTMIKNMIEKIEKTPVITPPANSGSTISDDIFKREDINKLVWKLFDVDENGKIYFTHVEGYEKYYLKETINSDISRQVKETIKNLIDENHYVHVFAGSNSSGVGIKYGKTWKGIDSGHMLFDFYFREIKSFERSSNINPKPSDKSSISMKLSTLTWNGEGREFYESKLSSSLKAIFGESTGQEIAKYVISEYDDLLKTIKPGDIKYSKHDTKIFNNVQVDLSVDFTNMYFYFSFLK